VRKKGRKGTEYTGNGMIVECISLLCNSGMEEDGQEQNCNVLVDLKVPPLAIFQDLQMHRKEQLSFF